MVMPLEYQLSGYALKAVGRGFAEAIGVKMDFDLRWLIHHATSNSCIRCGKTYKGVKRGWLIQHYKKTGHWRMPE